MKALVIKAKLLHFSEVVCLKSVFISLIVTTREKQFCLNQEREH